jgi:uncharacterized cupin superfamily protein
MTGPVFNLLELELSPATEERPEGHVFRGRSVSRELGASLTGMSVYEVEPGQATWPYHFELVEEEWLIVIAGEVTLRTPEGERSLRAGDVACFSAGPAGAHAVRNDGDVVARFAMPSSVAPYGDAVVYPDSGKFRVGGGGFNHRGRLGEEVGYWEGEA